MIKTLSERGRSSRIIAAGAIALSYQRSGPVFYLSDLEKLHQARAQQQDLPSGPPSRKLLGELFGLDSNQDVSVQQEVHLAKQDIEQDFPGIDFPYPLSWGIHRNIEVANVYNTPFMGTIIKATLSNMVDIVDDLDVSNVACLTEPRIVDALFDNCGALLILPQDPNSPQCRRLQDRGIPFAMLSQEVMSKLSDGDHIVVDQGSVSLLQGAR